MSDPRSATPLLEHPRIGNTADGRTTIDQAVAVPAGRPWPELTGFEVLREIGLGGMGVVYQARQISLNRIVAVKMLRALTAEPTAVARLQREAQAVARLQHPGIVQVFATGEQDGHPYIVLEYVDGQPLDKRLCGQPLDAAEAVALTQRMAQAVAAAHEKQIIHRDLKPSNVLLTPAGEPKIADFGLAKLLDADTQETRRGAVMGSPCYMAPEQAAGQSHVATPAVDVYALGALLYEMLTGRPPFRGADAAETLEQVLTADVIPPSRLRPSLPPALDAICLACLQKNPTQRMPSADALATELQRWQDKQPCRVPSPLPADGRRTTRLLAGLNMLQFALVIALALALWQIPQSKTPSTPAPADDPVALLARQIELERQTAPERVKNIRRLAVSDNVRYPDIEMGLIKTLRSDPIEEVRYEAVLAMEKCREVTKKMLDALDITASQSDRDGFPKETSARVISQARQVYESRKPISEKPPEEKPAPPSVS